MKRIDLIKTGGFKAGEHLDVANVATPTPAHNEVVIQVAATAVNPIDFKEAEYGLFLPSVLPAALGCEVAGVVVDCSSELESTLKGKRVVTYLGASKVDHPTDKGAYVEKVAIGADVVTEIPDDVSFVDAVTLPVGSLTATLLLNGLAKKPNGWIVVYGASSAVGFYTVQLAVRNGYKVIAVASSKHEASLKTLGARGFVDYRIDDFETKVKEICGTEKLVGAADCIGSPSTFTPCGKIVKELGDESVDLVVTTVLPGLPDPPTGVKNSPVELGGALDRQEDRKVMIKGMSEIMSLKTMPVRLLRGPFSAETVEEAFQISKNGVSGEKIVIEWTS